jgi:hypothetical protein
MIPAIYKAELLAQDDVAIDEDDFEDDIDLDASAAKEESPSAT